MAEAFPPGIERVLDEETRDAWARIRPLVPPGSYLAGGTAVAVHLRHRLSRDLDFFTTVALDVEALLDELTESELQFLTSRVAPRGGSLAIVLGSTKIEFTDASAVDLVEPTETVAGLEFAGLGDLLAMKLAVITERKQLRDYEDLRVIEERGGRRVEEGLALYAQRYHLRDEAGILAVPRALADVHRCGEDALIETPRSELLDYWGARLPAIVASLSRWEVGELPQDLAIALLGYPSSGLEVVGEVPVAVGPAGGAATTPEAASGACGSTQTRSGEPCRNPASTCP